MGNESSTNHERLVVENAYKIFGGDPEPAFKLLKEGKAKEEIYKKTGLTIGVQNASFSVSSGEIFVIMGLSGSGKSTLVRCINRLVEPTKGNVYLEDSSGETVNVTTLSSDALREVRRERISMVFQEFALFPHMSVLENVVYALRIKGEQNCEKKGREMLDEVGLSGWGEVSPSELSGGMKQRVGVARAFVTNSDVVLMDEPFSALDPLIRREMQEWFLDELKHKFEFERTIFFITHDLQEALRVGDRIAIMKEGQMVQIGSPQDILQNPADEYVQAFVQDIKELAEEGDLF